MARLTAIDLFSGAGGLTEGLKWAGFRVVAAIERDESAAQSYRLNHPRVPMIRGDIREMTGPGILRAARFVGDRIDLIAACPPCQGFSAIRTRNAPRAARDDRNALIHDVSRLVRSLRPRAVLLENVPRLATSSHFRRFVAGLQRSGYVCSWEIVDAAEFGVPQHRRRLVLVAVAEGQVPKPTVVSTARSVRQAIGRLPLPSRSRDPLHAYRVQTSDTVRRRLRALPRDGGNRADLPVALQLDCHMGTTGFRDVYGRMAWDRPAPTLTGGCINPSKGRFVHPSQNRAITLREAALLQGFPRSYKFDLSRGRYAAALQVGNAVPPRLAMAHALALRETLGKR